MRAKQTRSERHHLRAQLAEAGNVERRLRHRVERLERENATLRRNLAAVVRAAREAGHEVFRVGCNAHE